MSAPATESEPTAVGATDVRDLVWAAAGGLNPDDRQVFELMVRHGLSAPDVAAVLGIAPDHAHARLSRARGQLERALGALLVAPAALWQRIRLTSSEPGGQAARQQITARTDRFDAATGFPLAARTARGGRLATAAMAAVVVLLLLLGGYAGMRLLDTGDPAATTVGTGPTATGAAPTGPATTPAPVATTPSPSPPPTTAGPVETTAAAPGPAGTPSASSSPGPSPIASATGSPAPPPFSVTAEASTRCGGTVSAPTFYLVVTATATGGDVRLGRPVLVGPARQQTTVDVDDPVRHHGPHAGRPDRRHHGHLVGERGQRHRREGEHRHDGHHGGLPGGRLMPLRRRYGTTGHVQSDAAAVTPAGVATRRGGDRSAARRTRCRPDPPARRCRRCGRRAERRRGRSARQPPPAGRRPPGAARSAAGSAPLSAPRACHPMRPMRLSCRRAVTGSRSARPGPTPGASPAPCSRTGRPAGCRHR